MSHMTIASEFALTIRANGILVGLNVNHMAHCSMPGVILSSSSECTCTLYDSPNGFQS
eukprot:SAG22_NODE_18247_length_290_cov_1.078534_1_plen_57_part_10